MGCLVWLCIHMSFRLARVSGLLVFTVLLSLFHVLCVFYCITGLIDTLFWFYALVLYYMLFYGLRRGICTCGLHLSLPRFQPWENRAWWWSRFSPLVLPISVTRWSQFSGRHVPSAATFFGVSTYKLSGAINVFLLLTVRPKLLLLIRPDKDELGKPETEPAHQNPRSTGDAVLPETANYEHGLMLTTTAFAADGSGSETSATVSRVSPKQMSVDV